MTEQAAVVLDASLDIAHAAKAKEQLEAALVNDGDITLDGSAVERVDAAGLQLLGSYFKHCQQQKRVCTWSASSDVLQHSAAGLGLAQALQLKSDTNSSTDLEAQ
ncbi:MAG: STAS domain-containing protein [Oceanococcus sp.]